LVRWPHADRVENLCTFKEKITAMAHSPVTDYVAVALGRPGESGYVNLMWTGLKPSTIAPTNIKHADTILDVAFHPAGRILATCGYDTRIQLTDLGIPAKGAPLKEIVKSAELPDKLLFTLKEHSDAVYGIAFSPDGTQLASCSADRAVKVFDVANGKLLYTLG
jgi:WD40 repeat protein